MALHVPHVSFINLKNLKINSNRFSIKLKRHEASSIAVKIPEMFQVKFEKMAKPT